MRMDGLEQVCKNVVQMFKRHPASKGMTYLQHLGNSLLFSAWSLLSSIIFLLHAIFPFIFTETGSTLINRLAKRLNNIEHEPSPVVRKIPSLGCIDSDEEEEEDMNERIRLKLARDGSISKSISDGTENDTPPPQEDIGVSLSDTSNNKDDPEGEQLMQMLAEEYSRCRNDPLKTALSQEAPPKEEPKKQFQDEDQTLLEKTSFAKEEPKKQFQEEEVNEDQTLLEKTSFASGNTGNRSFPDLHPYSLRNRKKTSTEEE